MWSSGLLLCVIDGETGKRQGPDQISPINGAILSGSQLCRAGRSLLHQCTSPHPLQPPPISGQHILATVLLPGRGSCCSIDLGLSPCSAHLVLPGTQNTTLGILLRGPWVGPCELLPGCGLGCRVGGLPSRTICVWV